MATHMGLALLLSFAVASTSAMAAGPIRCPLGSQSHCPQHQFCDITNTVCRPYGNPVPVGAQCGGYNPANRTGFLATDDADGIAAIGYTARAGDRRSVPCAAGSSCVRRSASVWVCMANSRLPRGVAADPPLQPVQATAGAPGPSSRVLLGAFMACSQDSQCASKRCHFPGHVMPDHSKWCAQCSSDGHCGRADSYCNTPADGVPVCFQYGPACRRDDDAVCSRWVARYAASVRASGFAICDRSTRGGSRCRLVAP